MEDTELETVIFATQVHAIEPGEREIEEAKASLNDLKTLLPPGVDPEDNPDLLFCAGNIAVAGVVNRNDDGMDKITALAVYRNFEKKFIDFEHSRKQVVGYVLHAGLSEIGTNRVITEEEAAKSDQPFNIALVFVIWKAVNSELADDIIAASNPAHTEYNSISLSFEMAFKGWYIAILPENEILISKATRLITPDDKNFPKWKKTLRAYKGNGRPLEGEGRVYRILPVTTIPLGGGLVEQPAAPVKGVTVITESQNNIAVPAQPVVAPACENEPEDEGDDMDDELEYRAVAQVRFNNFYETAAKVINFGVSSFTPSSINQSNMNDQDIKAYKDKVVKADKLEDFKEVAIASTAVIDAIVAESERREQAKKAAEANATEIARVKAEVETARDQAIRDLGTTKEELVALKAELEQIKAAQQAEAMARKFDERMNLITSTFDFTDDERNEVAADIRNLDDTAFAKFMDKSKKLMKEKTKEFKKAKNDEAKAAREQLVASLKAKGVEVKLSETLNVEEVIASALANPTSTPAGSNLEAAKSLKDRAQAAFANVTIGGKKFSELEESK